MLFVLDLLHVVLDSYSQKSHRITSESSESEAGALEAVESGRVMIGGLEWPTRKKYQVHFKNLGYTIINTLCDLNYLLKNTRGHHV